MRKIWTKIASQQNSVNNHSRAKLHTNQTQNLELTTVKKITNRVQNYTQSVKLHKCKITHTSVKLHRVYNYALSKITPSLKLHTKSKITHCKKLHAECKITHCKKLHTECKITHKV